jgi:hypothetical protein
MVKVWDAQTGAETLTVRGHNAELRGVAFSPDGKQIASAGGFEEPAAVACQKPQIGRLGIGHAAGPGVAEEHPPGDGVASRAVKRG